MANLPTREDDDRVLEALRLWERNETTFQIARTVGSTRDIVQRWVRKVRKYDSGYCEDGREYWSDAQSRRSAR